MSLIKMRVLNFSLEKKLFEDGSSPQKRVIEYSGLFGRFDLVVMTGKGFKKKEFPNMEIRPINSASKFLYPFDAWRLGMKLAKKYRSDLISVQDPFEMGFVGWLLAKKIGLKFQVQLHGDFFGSPYWRREKFSNRFRYFLGKFVLGRADGIRAVSQRIKKSLTEMGIPEEKISVVPIYTEITNNLFARTTADRQEIITRKEKLDNKFVFLTVGRLVRVKNIMMQIEAMAEIVKKYPQSELWIVGEGPEERDLKKYAEMLGVIEKIKFIGGWPSDLDEFYNQADAFLLTSNYEGWGMVVVEAAAYGLPIIMTDVGCAGETIKNGESGLVIPVGNKEALIQSMERLICDKILCERLGIEATREVLLLPGREASLQLYKEASEKL